MSVMKSQTFIRRDPIRRFEKHEVNRRFRSNGALNTPITIALGGVVLFATLFSLQIFFFAQ